MESSSYLHTRSSCPGHQGGPCSFPRKKSGQNCNVRSCYKLQRVLRPSRTKCLLSQARPCYGPRVDYKAPSLNSGHKKGLPDTPG